MGFWTCLWGRGWPGWPIFVRTSLYRFQVSGVAIRLMYTESSGNILVAADPSAKSLTFCGFVEAP